MNISVLGRAVKRAFARGGKNFGGAGRARVCHGFASARGAAHRQALAEPVAPAGPYASASTAAISGATMAASRRRGENLVPAGRFRLIQGAVGPGQQGVLRIALGRLGHAAADGHRQLAGHLLPQAFGKQGRPRQIGLRHHHHEFLAAIAGHRVGLAGEFVEQPGQLLQHLVAVEVPLLVVDVLEVIHVQHRQRERRPVAVHHGELVRHRVGHAAAVVDAGQGIGPHFRERHQVVALLADLVVGVGDLGGQVEGGLEDLLGLAAELLPTGFLAIVVELAHPIAELAHAGMVLGQVLPQVPGDLLQFGGHQLARRNSRRERKAESSLGTFERRPKM